MFNSSYVVLFISSLPAHLSVQIGQEQKEVKMPKFRVLAGKHNEPVLNKKGEPTGAYKTFTEGKEFESPHPLDEMFMNKFERVGEDTRQGRDYDPTFDKDDVMDEPEVVKRARAKKAAEEEPAKPTAKKDSHGAIGAPAPKHKEAARRGKKASAEEDEDLPKVKAPDEEEESEEEEGQEEQEEGEEDQDVTDQFDKTDEADVKVQKRGREYYVFDSSAPDSPLNKDPFTNKQEVQKFVKSLAEDEE